jgi:hypothetical protein
MTTLAISLQAINGGYNHKSRKTPILSRASGDIVIVVYVNPKRACGKLGIWGKIADVEIIDFLLANK